MYDTGRLLLAERPRSCVTEEGTDCVVKWILNSIVGLLIGVALITITGRGVLDAPFGQPNGSSQPQPRIVQARQEIVLPLRGRQLGEGVVTCLLQVSLDPAPVAEPIAMAVIRGAVFRNAAERIWSSETVVANSVTAGCSKEVLEISTLTTADWLLGRLEWTGLWMDVRSIPREAMQKAR